MLESQITTPALMVDLDIMERNMARMEKLTAEAGASLRPHYKSHKSTVISHMQLARGAKGVCCAKLSEAFDLVESGIEDVLIANQVTDRFGINTAAMLAGRCRLTVCVDDAENISALGYAAMEAGTKIHCLVEYDVGMNRCGVHTKEEALSLARAADSCRNLSFEGIQAYAGNNAHRFEREARMECSRDVEARVRELKALMEGAGLAVREVQGVSTGTVENLRPGTVYTDIQAGSYIFMDATYGKMGLAFENSLFVLTGVIHSEASHIVTDAGVKSLSMDQSKPVFREFPENEIDWSEEHSSIPNAKAGVGDRLHIIPGHCCTTVNLYDSLYFVRQGRVTDKVPVTSRGKCV